MAPEQYCLEESSGRKELEPPSGCMSDEEAYEDRREIEGKEQIVPTNNGEPRLLQDNTTTNSTAPQITTTAAVEDDEVAVEKQSSTDVEV